LQYESFDPYTGNFEMGALPVIREKLAAVRARVQDELVSQGAQEESLTFVESLDMRYFGTDTVITIPKPDDEEYAAAFSAHHLREFSFVLSRAVTIESVKVRGTGHAQIVPKDPTPFDALGKLKKSSNVVPTSSATQKVYSGDSWKEVPIYRLEDIAKLSVLDGPAMIIDKTQTIFVDPMFQGYILDSHVILERVDDPAQDKQVISHETINPIQLSVFAHRFMAIAEQMGNTLQRTSISTSIKERLDFSCAIFSPQGKLVANAPHIPIHLGSMQFAIQAQHKLWAGKLKPGDAVVTNHPEWGGTHLPDLTVVCPAFVGDELAFYVASRGHHTDIGGKGITSMMPESKLLWEEGINLTSLKIVSGGEFLEDEVRAAFMKAGDFPGCSPTRRIQDNISDLKAQIASNQRGINLLHKLCEEFTLPVVDTYMHGIQKNAEYAVREFFKSIARENSEPLTSVDYYDDSTAIKLKITIDTDTGSAVFDFAGTGPQSWGNYNCPVSITHSAVIYSVRCLINTDIPLNEGCLAPVDIRIPRGSILRPTAASAICGSTLASQRVVDTILRAFKRVAASQGCANSFGWGMGGRNPATGEIEPGWNYGESLGGGTGAGPGWHGEHATNVHSTNTKNTDAEVIEKRTAVIVRQYGIRRGSGGNGEWKGGDGIIREIEARIPLKFSILSDRRVYRPYGMAGGQPGQRGQNFAFKKNEEGGMDMINLGGKAIVDLLPGERIQINTPGGGGWGNPPVGEGEDRQDEQLQ
jgi:5-oxoprolinase (ATP-hydrolysing)